MLGRCSYNDVTLSGVEVRFTVLRILVRAGSVTLFFDSIRVRAWQSLAETRRSGR